MKKSFLHFTFALVLSLLGLAGALATQGVGNVNSLFAQAAGSTQPARTEANIYCVAVISNTYPGCTQVFTSVQAAIDVALPDDLIKVARGVYTDVHLREGIIQVVYLSKTLTIQGGYTTTNWITPNLEANLTTLDAQGQGRGIYIIGTITPTIEGLRITGGQSDLGGGLYIRQAAGTLRNNIVLSNTASQKGGGLYLLDATIMITGNLFTSNRSFNEGGGLFLDHSVQTVTNNFVTSNTAILGGGLYVHSVTGLVQDNIVTSNSASLDGGGIFLYRAPITVGRNSFIANTAGQNGGGIYLWDGLTLVTSNLVLSNTAHNNGGGMYPWYGVNTIVNNQVTNNTALNSGGGIFFDHSTQTIDGNVVTSNTAQYGGGLYLLSLLPTTLSNTVVADNQASIGGSGVYIDRGVLDTCVPTFLQTTVARNSGGDGSGVYLGTGCSLAMSNTILANQAAGIILEGGTQATLDGILWYSNTTNHAGAGTFIATNEITGTPAFTADGYHLASDSTAINHGLNTGVDHDIDGHPRPFGASYDLGADEFAASLLMAKQADAQVVQAGAQLTYTILITNNGFVDLHAVITDTLPDQVTPAGVLTWTALITAPGGVWIQPIVVTVTPGYSGTLTNYAQVTSQESVAGDSQITINAIGFRLYLPFVARTLPTCTGNVLTNGDFEQGHTGWYTYTTGSWWKQHDLIGSDDQGFEPYQGHYAAILGGYEGVWDVITQTVVIPVQGSLTYWWKGWSHETLPHMDTFDVALLNQNGIQIALLTHHDDQDVQDIWKQDAVDVSAYAGQVLTLRFSSYNDNYYYSWFNLDTICLSTASSR